MPTYCYKCDEHKESRRTIICSVAKMESGELVPECSICNSKMRRDFRLESAGIDGDSVAKGRYPLLDENLGSEPVLVESPQHHRRIMKEQGLYVREPSADVRARRRQAGRKYY